jgi:hypothetical protein
MATAQIATAQIATAQMATAQITTAQMATSQTFFNNLQLTKSIFATRLLEWELLFSSSHSVRPNMNDWLNCDC